MLRFLPVLLLVFAIGPSLPALAELEPNLDVQAKNRVLQINTHIDAPYSLDDAWAVLQDYDRLAEYMPNVDSSLVVGQTDSSVLVRQVFTTRLILPWTFRFTLEFVKESANVLIFRMLEGNLRSYRGRWTVVPQPHVPESSVRISYWAEVGYGFRLPGFIIAYITRRQIREMMPELVREIGRNKKRQVSK